VIVLAAVAGSAAAKEALLQRYIAVADAEREFAAAGLRDGVQRSFIAHFADDGVVLKPFATPASEWYRAHPDRPGSKLIWAPQFVAVSAAGDLGLSSGPWRFEAEKDGKPVRAYGHFVSIWRRGANGHWQVLFDHGLVHDAPVTAVEVTPLVALPVASVGKAGESDARRAALAAADDALRERLRSDRASAYGAIARDATLWLRDGAMPVQAATPPAAVTAGACGCGPRASMSVAKSGDFAYTTGGAAGERERGVDLRAWRFDDDHGWLLVADMAAAAD
jgi:ketosteroid isomerase-like protein